MIHNDAPIAQTETLPVLDSLRETLADDPLLTLGVIAAAVAFALAPLAMAVVAANGWFQARRGRKIQKPHFSSIVIATILVMAVPAILLALLIKSRSFDRNRYEFDPNRTISVLDEGRRFQSQKLLESLYKADEGIRAERDELDKGRKLLANGLRELDQAMLAAAKDAGPTAPTLWPRFEKILASVADARQWAGVDAPQQLIDLTARPVEMRSVDLAGAPPAQPAAPIAATIPVPTNTSPAIEAALAKTPPDQRRIAALLPLASLPIGWSLSARADDPPFESFNAANLYEKINGRAESFIQFSVKGMACAAYHNAADPNTEVQFYLFEMGDPFKALGKFGSEKPDEAKVIDLGAEGYTSGGSVYFYADRYYAIVEVGEDNPKLTEFAIDLARRVARQIMPPTETQPAAAPAPTPAAQPATPQAMFALLPLEPAKSAPKYVAQDVFGYSFLSDVFLADYQSYGGAFQGFLRPYPSPEAARQAFDDYLAAVKKDGGEIKPIDAPGAERAVLCSNIGLYDAVFLKGNALAGANGATTERPAIEFAKKFAQSLPNQVPILAAPPPAVAPAPNSSEPANPADSESKRAKP
jgi:hypothetical protein